MGSKGRREGGVGNWEGTVGYLAGGNNRKRTPQHPVKLCPLSALPVYGNTIIVENKPRKNLGKVNKKGVRFFYPKILTEIVQKGFLK